MPTVIQTGLPGPPGETLPTMYDLPSEEIGESGLPDEFHFKQACLLWETFKPPTVPDDHVFSAIDMYLYYDIHHTNRYKRLDWFGVIGVPRLYEGWDFRRSYVIWQERVTPLIVVELLAPDVDEGELTRSQGEPDEPPTKLEVYEKILRVPYYALFGRQETELRVFQLCDGRYVEATGHNRRFWIAEAGLWLGLWRGSYDRQERLWLRWFGTQENRIPTDAERAEQYRQQAEQAMQTAQEYQQRTEHALRRIECMAEKLRQLGYDPDQV
ncbi:MAG TPA: Uma2 family endonuclease [Blastocatellia bacterium]|nr:Uma2 family endonuclease [Blastocatellia bacterium]